MTKIVVISLERSLSRRHHMSEELARAGTPFQFLSAVDGERGDHPLLRRHEPARSIGFYGKPLTAGAAGCFGSHFLAWQQCVESNEPLVVMEDDIKLLPNFAHTLDLLGPQLAKYPLIRLFGLNLHPFRVVREIEDMKLVRFLRGPAGTQCYAISPRGAAILLAGAQWFREPVDRYIDRFWSHGVQCLALQPYPMTLQGGWGSDTRIYESKSTPYTFVRKIVRVGEHVVRHLYNFREDIRSVLRR